MLISSIIRSTIKKSLHFRGDGWPTSPFYFPWDWENLEYEPFSFMSGKWKIRGYRYWKKGNEKPKAQVTFFHGIGAGHFAYTSLIYLFAQAGYLVYAYDNTGSALSEGTAIDSLSESVKNQKDFYEFLDKDPKAQGLRRYACGHSWGGFTALAALQKQYKVDKVISIAGFDSVVSAYIDSAPASAKVKKAMERMQKHDYGELGLVSGLQLMKETDAEVLYIQGDQDKMVNYETNGKAFQEALKDRPNIHFIIRKGWYHNPYWSRETEDYYLEISNPKDGMGTHNWRFDGKFRDDLLRSIDPQVEKALIDFYAE